MKKRSFRKLVAGLKLGFCFNALLIAFLWFVDRGGAGFLFSSSQRFNGSETLSDISSPERRLIRLDSIEIARIEPVPGASITHFETAKIWFSKPVLGVEGMVFNANGAPSQSVRGQGQGPYEIRFDPIESQVAKIVAHDGNQLTDLSGRPIKLEKRWDYRTGIESREGMLKFGDLRLRVLDSYPSKDELPNSRFSILNDGEGAVDTTGWKVSFKGLGLPDFVLPSRLILPGQKSFLTLIELTSASGASRPFNPSSQGRLILFDSNMPPNRIDAVDYEFSAADLDLSLTRVADRWVHSRAGVLVQGEMIETDTRLPFAPQADFPPGYYDELISVTLSSVDPQAVIWYTLDGSVPWKGNRRRYAQPIEVGKGVIIKACSRRGQLTSPVVSYSYLIGKARNVLSLPTISLSNVGFEESSRSIMFSSAGETAGVGSSLEVMNQDGELVGTGAAFLQSLGEQEVDSRLSRHAFRLRLSGQQEDAQKVYRGLRLHSVSSGETIRFLPANPAGKGEVIDWIVDAVGLERTVSSEAGKFANVVVNGFSIGRYRMIQDGPLQRESVLARGSQFTIVGDAGSWLRVFDRILDSNYSKRDTLKTLEQDFDLDWFAEYYLKTLFWGARGWPNRGELIIQDPVTQKWVFWPKGLDDAGMHWKEEPFEHTEDKINASGGIFDSLLRSARFRRILSDYFEGHFEPNSHVLRQQIEDKLSYLVEIFGSRVREIGERFTDRLVLARITQMSRYLIQRGLISKNPSPESGFSEKDKNVSIGVNDSNERGIDLGGESDSVRFNDDLWLIDSQSEKRVMVPVSDRDFEVWRRLEFEDDEWACGQGLIGFDTRGFSGRKFNSEFYDLMHNRSSGAFLRTSFNVDLNQLSTVDRLVLRCRINDGFGAYLNGEEIIRFNVPEAILWNSTASSDIRGTAWRFREFDISSIISQLIPGTNVLAVHAINSMLNGPSFLVDYELVGRRDYRGNRQLEATRTSSDQIDTNSVTEPLR